MSTDRLTNRSLPKAPKRPSKVAQGVLDLYDRMVKLPHDNARRWTLHRRINRRLLELAERDLASYYAGVQARRDEAARRWEAEDAETP